MKKIIAVISMCLLIFAANAQGGDKISYSNLSFREGANTIPIDKAQAIRFEKLGDQIMNVIAIDANGAKTKLLPVSEGSRNASLQTRSEQMRAICFVTADKSITLYILPLRDTFGNRYNADLYCRQDQAVVFNN